MLLKHLMDSSDKLNEDTVKAIGHRVYVVIWVMKRVCMCESLTIELTPLPDLP